MATFLDANTIGFFSPLFVLLLVFIAGYAILSKMKYFENGAINFIIAFVTAMLFATSDTAIRTITTATPWLIVIFSLLMFSVVIFKFLGADDKEFFLNPKHATTTTILSIIIVLIFIFAFGEVRREQNSELQGNSISDVDQGAIISFPGTLGQVLREPSVLGLILTLLIAVFAIMLLAAAPEMKK